MNTIGGTKVCESVFLDEIILELFSQKNIIITQSDLEDKDARYDLISNRNKQILKCENAHKNIKLDQIRKDATSDEQAKLETRKFHSEYSLLKHDLVSSDTNKKKKSYERLISKEFVKFLSLFEGEVEYPMSLRKFRNGNLSGMDKNDWLNLMKDFSKQLLSSLGKEEEKEGAWNAFIHHFGLYHLVPIFELNFDHNKISLEVEEKQDAFLSHVSKQLYPRYQSPLLETFFEIENQLFTHFEENIKQLVEETDFLIEDDTGTYSKMKYYVLKTLSNVVISSLCNLMVKENLVNNFKDNSKQSPIEIDEKIIDDFLDDLLNQLQKEAHDKAVQNEFLNRLKTDDGLYSLLNNEYKFD